MCIFTFSAWMQSLYSYGFTKAQCICFHECYFFIKINFFFLLIQFLLFLFVSLPSFTNHHITESDVPPSFQNSLSPSPYNSPIVPVRHSTRVTKTLSYLTNYVCSTSCANSSFITSPNSLTKVLPYANVMPHYKHLFWVLLLMLHLKSMHELLNIRCGRKLCRKNPSFGSKSNIEVGSFTS